MWENIQNKFCSLWCSIRRRHQLVMWFDSKLMVHEGKCMKKCITCNEVFICDMRKDVCYKYKF